MMNRFQALLSNSTLRRYTKGFEGTIKVGR